MKKVVAAAMMARAIEIKLVFVFSVIVFGICICVFSTISSIYHFGAKLVNNEKNNQDKIYPSMATKNTRPIHPIKLRKRAGDDGGKQKRDLDCFLNQPNINMVIPWLYDIKNTMKSRDSNNEEGGEKEEEQDEMEKSLQCFENQPNINMTIPWIYSIYKAVKSGGGGGEASVMEWDDRDFNGESGGN